VTFARHLQAGRFPFTRVSSDNIELPQAPPDVADILTKITEAADEARSRDQFVVMDVIRKQILPKFPADIRTSVQEVAVIGGGGAQNAAIQFVINGPDLKKLEVLGKQLVDRVKGIPGVVDIDTSLNTGKPELSIHVDRPKAADLGVQISDAAEALRLLVGGDQVTTFRADPTKVFAVAYSPKGEVVATGGADGGSDCVCGVQCHWFAGAASAIDAGQGARGTREKGPACFSQCGVLLALRRQNRPEIPARSHWRFCNPYLGVHRFRRGAKVDLWSHLAQGVQTPLWLLLGKRLSGSYKRRSRGLLPPCV
jgi:hypothetical protein